MSDITHLSSSQLGRASYSELTDENGMIEYLNCHRHDLPPAVWIENEPLPSLGNGR
jgi:hypothetical protein